MVNVWADDEVKSENGHPENPDFIHNYCLVCLSLVFLAQFNLFAVYSKLTHSILNQRSSRLVNRADGLTRANLLKLRRRANDNRSRARRKFSTEPPVYLSNCIGASPL